MLFGLFKQPEYRKFNLKPRYWDPEKEERELRERRIKAELGIKDDNEEYVPTIQGQFRQEYKKRKMARDSNSPIRSIRIFMILLFLLVAAFYIYIKHPETLMKLFGL